MLGEALLGLRQFDDAEALLLAGYQGLLQRESTMPPNARVRINVALERLVQLYTARE